MKLRKKKKMLFKMLRWMPWRLRMLARSLMKEDSLPPKPCLAYGGDPRVHCSAINIHAMCVARRLHGRCGERGSPHV